MLNAHLILIFHSMKIAPPTSKTTLINNLTEIENSVMTVLDIFGEFCNVFGTSFRPNILD